MNGPLVSVLLPFRDAATTLPSAIRSITRQSYRRLELIAVDDGSHDAGPAWLEQLARRDSRVKLVRQPPAGLCAALHLGLQHCSGALVARMDADDISLRTRLEEQVAELQREPALGAVGCQFRLAPRRLLSDGMRRYERWSNELVEPARIRRDLFVESPLCHPSVMLRASALRAAGGYPPVDPAWPEDYDLWFRLDETGYGLGKVPRVLLLWRERAERLSRTGEAYRTERFRALKLDHLIRRLRGRRVLVWGAGRDGKPWLRALAGCGVLEEQVIDVDPRKLGQRIHGCRVVPPSALGRPRRGRLVVVAVGSAGARPQIRSILDGEGYREPDDYICVA